MTRVSLVFELYCVYMMRNAFPMGVGGVSFLGTSGQNVGDIVKYSSMDDHLEILENTLRLRHLAPTAPDTLGIKHTTRRSFRVT